MAWELGHKADSADFSSFQFKYIDVPLNDKVVRDMLVKAEMNMTLESAMNATIDGDFTVKKILWIKNFKLQHFHIYLEIWNFEIGN